MPERVREIQGPRGGPRRGMPHEKVAHPWKIFGRIMKYVFGHSAFQMILVVICILAAVFASVQGTMFTRTLIDSYITPMLQDPGSADYGPLAAAILRVALFYGIGALATLVQSITMVYVSQGTMRRMRVDLFAHMQRLPVRYFDTHAHGDIMSVYTNDIDTLRQLISQSLPQMLNAVVTIVSIFAMMVMLSVPLTILTLCMVVVVMFLSSRATKIAGRSFTAQQRNLGALNGCIEEMMTGEKVIKVFCHEDEAIEEFEKLNTALAKSSYTANAYSGIIGPISAQLGNASYVLCAVTGCMLAVNMYAGFTVGALASFLTFNRSFNMPINQVTQQFNSIISALAGAERMFSLLDEEPEDDEGDVTLVHAVWTKDKEGRDVLKEVVKKTDPEGPDKEETAGDSGRGTAPGKEKQNGIQKDPGKKEPLVWAWKIPEKSTGHDAAKEDTGQQEKGKQPDDTGKRHPGLIPLRGDVVFKDVTFAYEKDKIVLNDISLYAKPGQKVALVGSTGAGKTTITNLLTRFYDIKEGKILYDGIDLPRIKKQDLRHSLGMVLQDTHLFTGSVAANIRYGKLDASMEEVERAARLANADSFIRRLPQGYDTILTGDGGNLSQGQRQLLAIARAAIADPPVLILDEATSSIDTRTEKIVQDGMDRLMKGRTTFVIAHRLSTIRNSDVILVLEHGRIVERGNHEQLLEMKGRYYQLYTGKKPELIG